MSIRRLLSYRHRTPSVPTVSAAPTVVDRMEKKRPRVPFAHRATGRPETDPGRDDDQLLGQTQLAREFDLPAQFRFRDARSHFLNLCGTSQYQYMSSAEGHSDILTRLPRRVSRRRFARFLFLLAFHTAAASGTIPPYWHHSETVAITLKYIAPQAAFYFAADTGLMLHARRTALRNTESFGDSLRIAVEQKQAAVSYTSALQSTVRPIPQ